MTERTLSFDFTPRAPEEPRAPRKSDEGPRPMTVGELDRAIKLAVEGTFGDDAIWVEGEVTGARSAPSGHLYLCLKDEREDASIDVVLYKTNVGPRARSLLVDGARARLRGRPTFWAPRGKVQFVADRVAPAGKGALLEALEKLKAKLAAEGLFAEERKRPLPREPRVIGVVTSASGAVIHDVCRVAFRRGGARILLAPAVVQGPGASESIRRALFALQKVSEVDAIIVGRGGGSADELSAFNDEAVVRAVAKCRVPIVSAVGHEVDVTLTDFAADARAATPSQAAEMLVPDANARRDQLRQVKARLWRAMRGRLDADRVQLGRIERRLGDPRLLIASHQQVQDDRVLRLRAAIASAIQRRRDGLSRGAQRLAAQHPRAVLAREKTALVGVSERLFAAGRVIVAKRASSVGTLGARLDALSPLKVLARGYAIALKEDGHAVRSVDDVREGDRVVVRVADGHIEAEARRVEKGE